MFLIDKRVKLFTSPDRNAITKIIGRICEGSSKMREIYYNLLKKSSQNGRRLKERMFQLKFCTKKIIVDVKLRSSKSYEIDIYLYVTLYI